MLAFAYRLGALADLLQAGRQSVVRVYALIRQGAQPINDEVRSDCRIEGCIFGCTTVINLFDMRSVFTGGF